LTQRLLAFSRQQPLSPEPLIINKLVAGMSELLDRTLGEQVKVETVLAAGLWQVKADPAQLENAILNLAVNARDAMPGGGRLTIETLNAFVDDAMLRSTRSRLASMCLSRWRIRARACRRMSSQGPSILSLQPSAPERGRVWA
jgi:signal transduction histidine kinase